MTDVVDLVRGRCRVYFGDCRMMLRELEAESVHTVVTSPPYWNLRDYGTGTWEGGDQDCNHTHKNMRPDHTGTTMLGRGKQKASANAVSPMRATCSRCGAKRIDCQIGLEETPDEYVATMVEVFREVRRVLRPDGTLWLNIGDSYAHGGCGSRDADRWPKQSRNDHMPTHPKRAAGLPRKSLIGIPWRVALALQADGWILRMDNIWHKPSPMPESVKDRPSRAHEYLFLFSKSRHYYFDIDAIRVPQKSRGERHEGRSGYREGHPSKGGIRERALHPRGANAKSVWRLEEIEVPSVFTIAQEPYPHSHFATFPSALVEPCVLAGAPVGGRVLDPFVGSGTALEVSLRLGRHAYGIEANREYLRLIEMRLDGLQLPLLAPGIVDAS